MVYLLRLRLIKGKIAKWIIILQEYDLELITPKSKKALALEEFISFHLMSDIPLDNLLDEHLFTIYADNS